MRCPLLSSVPELIRSKQYFLRESVARSGGEKPTVPIPNGQMSSVIWQRSKTRCTKIERQDTMRLCVNSCALVLFLKVLISVPFPGDKGHLAFMPICCQCHVANMKVNIEVFSSQRQDHRSSEGRINECTTGSAGKEKLFCVLVTVHKYIQSVWLVGGSVHTVWLAGGPSKEYDLEGSKPLRDFRKKTYKENRNFTISKDFLVFFCSLC